MVEHVWFDGNAWGWLPGTALGMMGGLIGTLCGTLAPRGQARGLVVGIMWGTLAVCLALLGTAIYAWWIGQPYGVWYGLGLAGLLGPLVIGPLIPVVENVYRMAEERKMHAKDARFGDL
jgi:hypothetical protein